MLRNIRLLRTAAEQGHPDVSAMIPQAPDSRYFTLLPLGQSEVLQEVVARAPGQVPNLLGVTDCPPERMERVIRMPHKPSATTANKVVMQPVLSDFAVAYVLEHGGQWALNELGDRHARRITSAERGYAIDKMARKYKVLSGVGFPFRHEGRPSLGRCIAAGSRAALDQAYASLQLLLDNDPDWEPRGRRKRDADGCLIALQAAGYELPERLQDVTAPATPEKVLEGPSRTNYQDGVYCALNPAFLQEFDKCETAQQVEIAKSLQTWRLWERIDRPEQITFEYPIKPPGCLCESHWPSERLVRAMPFKHAIAWRNGAPRVIFRLLERDRTPEGWVDFESLADTWEGTVGDLLDTLQSMG